MNKKSIKLFVLFLIIIFYKDVCALSQTTTQKRITTDSNIVTLYVGNVSVDGESKIKYLFTDKSISADTYDVIKSLLDNEYKSLLPSKPGFNKIIISSTNYVNSFEMDSNWVSASYVANKYYGDAGLIVDNSSEYLYDNNHFKELRTQYLANTQNDYNALEQYNTEYQTEKNNWELANDGDFSELYTYLPPLVVNSDFDSFEKDEVIIEESFGIQPGYAKYNGEMTAYTTLLKTKVKLKIVNTNVNVVSPKYDYIFGNDQIYTLGTETGATFKIDTDYSYFENGGKVYVDNILVDSNNYESESGSTIITFKKEFLDTLSVGEHSLKVVFNNDGVAETKFYVANAVAPETSDNIILYLINLLVSMFCLSLVSKRVIANKNN